MIDSTQFRIALVGLIAATCVLWSVASVAQRQTIRVVLEVASVDGQEVLQAVSNTNRCTEITERITQEDTENPACIHVPARNGGYNMVWALDSEECVRNQSGYTLREIMLAEERGDFGRAIRSRTRHDFRINDIRASFNTGEFRRKSSREILVTNGNSGAYVIFYRVVGRNCATGESIQIEAPLRNGGRNPG